MADDTRYADGTLHCPVCSTMMVVRLLELEDEDRAEPETLLLLDCLEGHVHDPLTHNDIVAAVSAEVWERLSL